MSLVMRQNRLKRHSRARAWRNGVIALALAGTGLGTAFATVGIGNAPAPEAERALKQTIVRQRIAQGLPAQPPPAGTAPDLTQPPASKAVTRESILAEVDTFESEMKELINQVDDMKKKAYAAKDIIRLNFLTTKFEEMKLIETTVAPVIASIRQPGLELFVMQAKLSTIRQGLDQLRQAAAQAAASLGDGMDIVSAADPSTTGVGAKDNDGIADLPGPGSPSPTDFFRPAPASPYR
jgi:hypothetical protein